MVRIDVFFFSDQNQRRWDWGARRWNRRSWNVSFIFLLLILERPKLIFNFKKGNRDSYYSNLWIIDNRTWSNVPNTHLYFPICDQLFTVALIFCSPPVAQVGSWELPRGNLAIERVIGNGAFGVVSKAYARDLPDKPEWTIVAVKSLQGNL